MGIIRIRMRFKFKMMVSMQHVVAMFSYLKYFSQTDIIQKIFYYVPAGVNTIVNKITIQIWQFDEMFERIQLEYNIYKRFASPRMGTRLGMHRFLR